MWPCMVRVVSVNKNTTGSLTDSQCNWLEKGRNRCDAFRSSGKRHILSQYSLSCSKQSQSKFGEVGAGVAIGGLRSNSNTLLLTFTYI